MQVGAVQKIISVLSLAFQGLGVTVSLEKLEELAVTIHRAMTVQARHFHTLEHVFTFVDTEDPIRTLASLYHDIVYFQVDMGFLPQIWEQISPYVVQIHNDFFVTMTLPPGDRLTALTLEVFDLQPGQRLSSVAALNEFMSALVMNKELAGLLPEKDLLRMTVCIEATIPFRKRNAQGETPFDLMEKRLMAIVEKHDIPLEKEDVIETIKTAVIFANKDIENFAESDPGRFLDNTWKLLPETNAALRLPDVYSIGTYRQALQKMESFFQSLDPDTIFNQYRGLPADQEYQQMMRSARNNIEIAREYLKIKILSMVILEALAIATGGDAPVSLFMGDVPREGVSIKRLEYFLPEIDFPDWLDQASVIYRLLESGRAGQTSFDMKNSPLSLFIYKSMSPGQVREALEKAREMYEGRLSADEFLMGLDKKVVGPIAQASSVMVYTRRQALMRYAS